MIEISKKQSFKTVANEGEAVYVDRKSKFIAHTKPVQSEQEALDFLQEMRSRYSDARHNVYAYIIAENNISRYSDDGEPGGTAGMPVLDIMKKEGIVDAVTVVTRYFGGTLLGTGGLVRAYSTAAAESVKNAGKITKILCDCYKVSTEYSLLDKIRHILNMKGYYLTNIEYSEKTELFVSVKKDDSETFLKDITEACSGRAEITKEEERYIDIKEGE
ncbi:MAG: YigZ family protein [Clostridia bacterium]|nr:YigZ family protein [Clostridia bacterium]